MHAVLDVNILISASLSRRGTPAQLLRRWLAGDFELVVSEQLLAELERALAYPKLRARISAEESAGLIDNLRQSAICKPDPPHTARRSADPDDDYLLALAETARAVLVSGDAHLLALAGELPIYTAATFLDMLDRAR